MRRLAVFARAPLAGRVKSRLSPALPAPLAARLYAGLLAQVTCPTLVLHGARDPLVPGLHPQAIHATLR